jgi:cytochrome P450
MLFSITLEFSALKKFAQNYVKEMIEERRNALIQGDHQRADLLTTLINGAAMHDEKAGQIGISDDEISGES